MIENCRLILGILVFVFVASYIYFVCKSALNNTVKAKQKKACTDLKSQLTNFLFSMAKDTNKDEEQWLIDMIKSVDNAKNYWQVMMALTKIYYNVEVQEHEKKISRSLQKIIQKRMEFYYIKYMNFGYTSPIFRAKQACRIADFILEDSEFYKKRLRKLEAIGVETLMINAIKFDMFADDKIKDTLIDSSLIKQIQELFGDYVIYQEFINDEFIVGYLKVNKKNELVYETKVGGKRWSIDTSYDGMKKSIEKLNF